MRFDWYQTTIDQPAEVVLNTLEKLGTRLVEDNRSAKRWHYAQGFDVQDDKGETKCKVFFGGQGGKPHAVATSDKTDDFVDLVRNEWADSHIVTRVDSAEDFADPKAYKNLTRLAKRIAKDHRLSFPAYVDPINPEAGKTQYIGAPTSDCRARIYEKGFEVLSKYKFAQRIGKIEEITDTATGLIVKPEEWVRMELQFRPRSEHARSLVAKLSPMEVWGLSNWTKELAEAALKSSVERIFARHKKATKTDQAFYFMCAQYMNVLNKKSSEQGGWAELGELIGQVISNLEHSKN